LVRDRIKKPTGLIWLETCAGIVNSMCVCVRAYVRACVCAYVRMCARACMRMCVCLKKHVLNIYLIDTGYNWCVCCIVLFHITVFEIEPSFFFGFFCFVQNP
jgi:hypothetical protein